MNFFALPNLVSKDVRRCDPATEKPAPGAHAHGNKEDYRKWCNDPTTQHCFYGPWEGVNPNVRASKTNPTKLVHGVVGDYDCKVTLEEIADAVDKADPKPTWTSTTFSGGARVVWEFEEPVLCDNPTILHKFLASLRKPLKLKNVLLPGFDETSLDPGRYFELGTNWTPVPGGSPLPSEWLGGLVFAAAAATPISTNTGIIPIEVLAEEVERRWPGEWPGEFKIGARGPLIWIRDGITRHGCEVGDQGMISYSNRAGKTFVPWDEVFDRDFVRKYEEQKAASAAEDLWYDGNVYWTKHDKEEDGWRDMKKEDCVMHLRCRGIRSSIIGKATASEADRVLDMVQRTHRVDGAVPFIHNHNTMVRDNGEIYLNISRKQPIMPAETGDPKDFPWLHEFFEKIWDAQFPEQREYFLAWFKRFYKGAIEGRLNSGQAIVIAGTAGQGKTLLNQFIIGKTMGGASDTGDYLMGLTAFNQEAAETAHWCIDDNKGTSNNKTNHRVFSESIKNHTANPRISYQPKHKNARTVPWQGRIGITCNTDAQSISVIPSLDATIRDKIMLFKFEESYHPTFLENRDQEAKILDELPHFLRWLLDWQPPASVLSSDPRFGVKPFHHPALVEAANHASYSYTLTEILDRWKQEYRTDGNKKKTEWEGTVLELHMELMKIQELSSLIQRDYSPIRLGMQLKDLLDSSHPGLSKRMLRGKPRYTISLITDDN